MVFVKKLNFDRVQRPKLHNFIEARPQKFPTIWTSIGLCTFVCGGPHPIDSNSNALRNGKPFFQVPMVQRTDIHRNYGQKKHGDKRFL